MEHGRGRVGIILVVLVGLVLATVMRQVAANQRGTAHLAAATPLSRMNSYALALLLGGLRGPLVMFLWPSSEGQKTERNLEDFDTKVEWIRLLQAEFDTVHIFQIWNKAYNISVLMANLANKYSTILDALEYAHNVDAERPNNINILVAIGGIYGDKLGNSAEKNYYKSRIREETRAREPLVRISFPPERRGEFTAVATRAGASAATLIFTADEKSNRTSVTLRQSLADAVRPHFQGPGVNYEPRPRPRMDRTAPGFRRTELDPMLDPQGNILPESLTPRAGQSVGANDGSELQYLKPFQPFSYGISAHALAYNYQKRAQVLLRDANQHHAQLSDLVVDSRPALSLRNWSEDAWERGRRAELEAFGLPAPSERAALEDEQRMEMERLSQGLAPGAQPVNPAALKEAIFEYDRSAEIADAAVDEYNLHLERFRTNLLTYLSHMEALQAQAALTRGDADFLKIIQGGDHAALTRTAADHYRRAVGQFQTLLLARYMEDRQVEQFFPSGVTRDTVQNLPPQQIAQLAERVRQDVAALGPTGSMHHDDWAEYYTYIRRAEARLRSLGAPLAAATELP